MKVLATAALFVLLAWGSAWSQAGKPTSVAELASYTGADRQQLLIEGAKREGKVVWYTTLIAYKEIAKIFEAKYPGVKVEAYRTGSTDLTKRVLTEARARRHVVDIVETTPPSLMAFRDEKLLAPYTSPHVAKYPDEAKEAAPKNLVYWTTDRESFLSVGFNKKLIPAADVPKNFDDLLKPSLKGKLAMSGDASGNRIIGAMLKAKGEEYVRKLRQQDIRLYMVSGGALNELVVGGEVGLSPTIFRNHVLVSEAQGAPVSWVPMDLVVNNAGGVAIYAHAQQPNAALLFADFLISPEGQNILEEKFRFGSPLKDYGFKRWVPEAGMTTDEYEKSANRWRKLLLSITRKS